jgi:cytochrome c biogenesis protein CcmG/thiol:disulfide interchange protein DsbE
VGSGWEVGDVATDFTLVDQHGDLVQLYQFYGRAVVLDMVAMWAGPCNDNAPIYEDWVFGEAAGAALTWVAVLEEGDNAPVRDEDAGLWAARHGLNHPVVADTPQSHAEWAKSVYPSLVVLGPDMVIAMVDPDPVDLDAILALAP